MDRGALEALSSTELQRLIAEATAVLAERRIGLKLEKIKRELKKELKSEVKREPRPVFGARSSKRGLDAPGEKEAEAEASQQPGSGSAAAPPSRQSASGKRVVVIPCKRSGVKGVTWVLGMNSWCVSWMQGGKRNRRHFSVHRHAEEHRGSYEEADAKALRDAVAFREGLARRGVIKQASAERQSGQQGVHWHRTSGRWTMRMVLSGINRTCCAFRPKDDTPEEIERAWLAAVERRRELEAEHLEVVIRRGAQPCGVETKESGAAGVTWRRFEGCWLAQIQRLGKRQQKRFQAEDLSPEAVETARLLAVRWCRDMEQRKTAEAAC